MSVVMPGKPVPRYYYTRHPKAAMNILQTGPRMVLEIPLYDQASVQLPPVQSPPSTSTATDIPSSLPPVQSPPSTSTATDIPSSLPPVQSPPSTSTATDIPSSLPPVQSPSSPLTTPLLLPDSTFQQLLADLLKDPDMEQILNDFPCNQDVGDVVFTMDKFPVESELLDMSPLVMDDLFMADDQTPLERELLE